MIPPIFARDCVTCPPQPPACSCPSTQQCIIVSRSCTSCSVANCIDPVSNAPATAGGVSKGALAGAVIGVLILLVASVSLFLWHKRRTAQLASGSSAKPDVPASAATVLSRPDPIEKRLSTLPPPQPENVRIYNAHSDTTINLDPDTQAAGHPNSQSRRNTQPSSILSNPFTDSHSIQTASNSTHSTNVIPIALVPHGTVTDPLRSPASTQQSFNSGSPQIPARPPRSPDLNIRMDPMSAALNLEHVNISSDSFRPPNAPYAFSTKSGLSSRASYMTNASYASDVLTEAPQILTPSTGAVRQVLGVAKAEVVKAPTSQPTSPLTETSRLTRASKLPARSPLVQSTFSSELASVSESDGQELIIPVNPFGDPTNKKSPSPSVTTFGTPSPGIVDERDSSPPPLHSTSSEPWVEHDWNRDSEASRMTTSMSPYAVTPGTSQTPNSSHALLRNKSISLEEQQAQALEFARARAAASGLGIRGSAGPGLGRRVSGSSVASAGGDSLLESFTFVPPSPISNRPSRSPLGKQVFAGGQTQPHLLGHSARHFSTMTTESHASGTSALEGYPFHIDSGNGTVTSPPGFIPPSVARATTTTPAGKEGALRQRASLDTLALTQDLSAFPLNFDGERDSFNPPK